MRNISKKEESQKQKREERKWGEMQSNGRGRKSNEKREKWEEEELTDDVSLGKYLFLVCGIKK